MAYGKRPRFWGMIMPALYGSIIVSVFAMFAFLFGLYFGSLYSPDFSLLGAAGPFILILVIPAAIFAIFIVWPVAAFSAECTAWLVRNTGRRHDWSIWLLVGALVGGPALFLYSFPLGLGRTMLGPLFLNGTLFGVICAALVRKFAGSQIDDTAIPLDDESADNPI